MFSSRVPVPIRLLKLLALTAAVVFLTLAAVSGDRQPVAEREQTGPARVLAEHAGDCWTGEAPRDVDLPGHVIWQHPDGRTVYSARLVGPALDTLFNDGDLPGSVVAFCR